MGGPEDDTRVATVACGGGEKQHTSSLFLFRLLFEGGRCVDEGSLRSGRVVALGIATAATTCSSHLGDDFDIVGGVETDPAVLAAFAPALFVLVL